MIDSYGRDTFHLSAEYLPDTPIAQVGESYAPKGKGIPSCHLERCMMSRSIEILCCDRNIHLHLHDTIHNPIQIESTMLAFGVGVSGYSSHYGLLNQTPTRSALDNTRYLVLWLHLKLRVQTFYR